MKWPTGDDKKSYNPYEEWTTSKGKKYSDFYLQMCQRVAIKIDELEEYEDKALYPDEIVGFIYDIMDECASVWGVPPNFMRYCSKKLKAQALMGTAGGIDHAIDVGIKEQGIDRDMVPMIPVVEYKLVPTGFINWYDPNLTKEQRKYQRNKYNDTVRLRQKKYKTPPKTGRPRKLRPEEVPPAVPTEEGDDE